MNPIAIGSHKMTNEQKDEEQCDQMVISFAQYFAICNKENLTSSKTYWHSWFKILAENYINPF